MRVHVQYCVAANFCIGVLLVINISCSSSNPGGHESETAATVEEDSNYDTEYESDLGGEFLFAEPLGGDDFEEYYGLWIKSDLAKGASATKQGGFYVTGGFASRAVFGRGTSNEVILETLDIQEDLPLASVSADMFLIKYDSNYQIEWAVRGGGTSQHPGGFDFGMSADTLPDGSVLVVGNCGSADARFDGVDGKQVVLDCTQAGFTFATRHTSNGELVFATILGEIDSFPYEYGGSPCFTDVGPDGGFVVTGRTPPGGSVLAPNSDAPLVLLFEKEDEYGVSLSRWDENGNIIWGRLIGPGAIEPVDVVVAHDGSIYLLLRFPSGNPQIDLGKDTDNEARISNCLGALIKYNKNGGFEWVKQFSGSNVNKLTITEQNKVAMLSGALAIQTPDGNKTELPHGDNVVVFNEGGNIDTQFVIENPYGGYRANSIVGLDGYHFGITGYVDNRTLVHDPNGKEYCREYTDGLGLECRAVWLGVFNEEGKEQWRTVDAYSSMGLNNSHSIFSLENERLLILGELRTPPEQSILPETIFGHEKSNETVVNIDGSWDGFVAVYRR